MRLVVAPLALVLACALPSAAAADPIPAGTYDVATNGGSVQIGSFLPAIAIPATPSAPVAVGSQPSQFPLPVTGAYPGTFNTLITGGSLSGTYTVTVSTASLSIDPATGSAELDLSVYATFSLSAVILTVPASTTCTLGDANAPLALHLTTASGAPWSAATGDFGMADKSFVIPTLACGDANLQSIVSLLIGGTSPGSNSAQVTGNAKREPDTSAAPTGPPAPPTSAPAPSAQTPAPTTGTTPTTPSTPAAKCVVPKLKGKTLKQVKKALKKAHCRLGKVRRAKARPHKKAKKGTVLKQGKKPGKRLPAGTRIAVTLVKNH